MDVPVTQFILAILVFLRVTSLIIVAPIVGNQTVPVQVKVGLGMFVAIVMIPLLAGQAPALDIKLGGLAVLAVKEIFVGLAIGFAMNVFFSALRYAGEFMAFMMGLSMASVYDPESAQNIPIVGELMYLFGILIFLIINGHHFALEALALSFRSVPVGTLSVGQPFADQLVSITGLMFIVAIKLASPVLVASFLTSISLAVMARVMPQANIMVISFPITIGVGVLVIGSAVPLLVFVLKKMLALFQENVIALVQVM